MGRPPCCDKVGVKKGPWTPEEDIILVTYIQEHGPGNWRSVPTNTGLLRCSKSCRLRWTNYLRPGIKRGNFTPHEEGMIIHLQALLGNKWAAIASYLPQRTDNDIKNYWNTHLKKKIKKFQASPSSDHSTHHPKYIFSTDEKRNTTDHMASTLEHPSRALTHNNNNSTSNSNIYASSTQNISRLLEGWMRSSPKTANINIPPSSLNDQNNNVGFRPKAEQHDDEEELISNEEFESILSFHNLNCTYGSWDHKIKHDSSDIEHNGLDQNDERKVDDVDNVRSERLRLDHNSSDNDHPPLSVLEKWLLDESSTCQAEEMMELPSIF